MSFIKRLIFLAIFIISVIIYLAIFCAAGVYYLAKWMVTGKPISKQFDHFSLDQEKRLEKFLDKVEGVLL